MSLRDRLDQDLKDAMRNRDVLRRSVLRFLRSAIQNEEIGTQETLDDDGVVGALARQAQQRRESIDAFTKGDRQDLVEKEKSELAILLEYLPKQMSSEEITEMLQQAIDEVGATGPQDMGKLMGRVMPQMKGKAEGREASSIASKLLNTLAGS